MTNATLSDELYPPAHAVALLEEGKVDPLDVIARVDVDACHFMPRIADDAPPPLIQTNYASYGQPSSGRLAFTPEDVAENMARGEKSILVVGHEALIYKLNGPDKKYFKKPDGIILVRPRLTRSENHRGFFDHFRMGLAFYKSVLIDSMLDPYFYFKEGTNYLTLSDGSVLSKGQQVTIDPLDGRLWDEGLDFIFPDYSKEPFLKALKQPDFLACATQLAFHVAKEEDWVYNSAYSQVLDGENYSIGLYRAEADFIERLIKYESKHLSPFFSALTVGAVPLSLEYWNYDEKLHSISNNYRLLDIHCLRDYFPDDLKKELLENKDHVTGSKLFTLRETLCRHQLSNGLRKYIKDKPSKRDVPQTIVIPDIKTPEEVLYFKKLVQDVTPANVKHLIRFGVMMETAEAFKNTDAIARHCDSLCYGLNDYTSARLGLDRAAQCGHWAFDSFHPVIAQEAAQSIAAARALNPNIFINICGHQTAGHHVASIDMLLGACDRLGARIDQFTVPPRIDFALRTQLALHRHSARKELGLPALG